MQTIIVGHQSRSEWIGKLQDALPGAAAHIDIDSQGAFQAHRKALELALATGKRCVIVEDDAIPVVGFGRLVDSWCERYPNSLISFYLGTGRPHKWQARVDDALSMSARDHIMLPTLIHGVCYSVPHHHVERVLQRLREGFVEGADMAIGRAWGREVLYPVESLVEHRDQGSVERHPDGMPRNEVRVARNLAATLMYER